MWGAMDIGTNSVRLLVADENYQAACRKVITTRLGEKVNENHFLLEAACERTIDALKELKELALEYGVSEVPVVATSAVRDAKNREEFIESVYRKTGLKVEVIPGKQEAYLTYLGIIADIKLPEGRTTVFDLGGGSTEFIAGRQEEIENLQSLDVGAVRMTEKFLLAGETEENCQKVKDFVKDLLQPHLSILAKPDIFIGVGGTATSLAAMKQKLSPYDPKKVHGYTLDIKDIYAVREEIKGLSVEERKNMKGLNPKRADIILAGVLIVEAIMEDLGIEKLLISENDLLLGLIREQIMGK